MRAGMRRALLLLVSVVAAGCVGDDGSFHGDPTFTLMVSNQSFDLDPVDVTVRIDDVVVVRDDFRVEGQHTWVPFDLALDPGPHSLVARTTAGDTEIETALVAPADGRRWGVLNFWYYAVGSPEPTPPQFSFQVSDERPAFD